MSTVEYFGLLQSTPTLLYKFSTSYLYSTHKNKAKDGLGFDLIFVQEVEKGVQRSTFYYQFWA